MDTRYQYCVRNSLITAYSDGALSSTPRASDKSSAKWTKTLGRTIIGACYQDGLAQAYQSAMRLTFCS